MSSYAVGLEPRCFALVPCAGIGERAATGGHVLTLDALDVSRRQMLALTVSDFLHELQAG